MKKIDYEKIKSIHFVGIKGVGMTPLAIIAKEAGFQVSGCDIGDLFITDEPLSKAGIAVKEGFSPNHLQNIDLVITTGAHGGYDNPEVKVAKENMVPILTQGEAVGIFMQGHLFGKELKGISVAGCHGKTTTTAMIATIFSQAGFDPSYVIGTSHIIPLGSPGHFGSGNYFIAEADEYATEPKYDHTPKFLWQRPQIAVITNIEHDHPDLYPTIDDTREAYVKFADNILQNSGLLVACGDDEQIQKLLQEYHGKVITYGTGINNDYRVSDIHTKSTQTFFSLDAKDVLLGQFRLSVVGDHNALNAAAACIVGIEAGISITAIQQGLAAFKGTKRRFEIKRRIPSGALIVDDYAHHPTEIKKTLRAAKDMFKAKKIICIFQPHTFSRTKLLFNEFSSSFINADLVILTDIYPSAREPYDATISSGLLAEAVRKCNKEVLFLSELTDVIKYIKEKEFGDQYVLITMGAGDVYKISDEILKSEIRNPKFKANAKSK